MIINWSSRGFASFLCGSARTDANRLVARGVGESHARRRRANSFLVHPGAGVGDMQGTQTLEASLSLVSTPIFGTKYLVSACSRSMRHAHAYIYRRTKLADFCVTSI